MEESWYMASPCKYSLVGLWTYAYLMMCQSHLLRTSHQCRPSSPCCIRLWHPRCADYCWFGFSSDDDRQQWLRLMHMDGWCTNEHWLSKGHSTHQNLSSKTTATCWWNPWLMTSPSCFFGSSSRMAPFLKICTWVEGWLYECGRGTLVE